MYSTKKKQVHEAPVCEAYESTVGRYLRYPDHTGKRIAEGGLRLQGWFKRTLPDQPLVSIITVCLNSAKSLEQCMLSVLRQNYDNIEYIIIDACSTDGTLDIISKYEDAVDYYLSEPDDGLYHAMNKGLELVSGDFILILNSDDWYQANCVEALVTAKQQTRFDVIAAQAQQIGENGQKLSVMSSIPFDSSIYLRMTLRHETMLVSRDIYQRIGGYSLDYKIISDWEFAIRLYIAGVSVYELPIPLLNFRITGASYQSQENVVLFNERSKLLRSQFDFLTDAEINFLTHRNQHDYNSIISLTDKYITQTMLFGALVSYCTDKISKGVWEEATPHKIGRPLVSVILPIFNAENYLTECLDSILGQTMSDFEIICINDKSTDNSSEILRFYQKKNLKIKVITNKNNLGHGASRNVGVRHSIGKYIFNIDPDDTMPARALDILTRVALNHNSDMVRGAYIKEQQFLGKGSAKPIRFSLASKERPVFHTTIQETQGLLTGPATIEGHWSYLYSRDVAVSCPWPTDLRMGQDGLFIVRAVLHAKKISVIDSLVYNYKFNSESAMNKFNYIKYRDVLTWRWHAWHLLNQSGLKDIGDFFLKDYPNSLWHKRFFEEYKKSPSKSGLSSIISNIERVYNDTGIHVNELCLNKNTMNNKAFFANAINGEVDVAHKCITHNIDDFDKKAPGESSVINPNFWSIATKITNCCLSKNIYEASKLFEEARSYLPDENGYSKHSDYLYELEKFINKYSDKNANGFSSLDVISSDKLSCQNLISTSHSSLDKDVGREPFGIIVFAHTRAVALKEVLESLQRQDALKFTEVWIDGDQGNREMRLKCEKVAELAESYHVKHVFKQRGNFGFRKMIILALREICKKYDEILILEDDCFPTRDAVEIFRNELNLIKNDKNIFSVYGHHFLVPAENKTCARFQGWGWGTTSEKLRPILKELVDCYSMTENAYLEFVKKSFTQSIREKIEVTPPRQPSNTFTKFFAWDETLCLLCAIHGLVHKPTEKRVVYNFGMGLKDSSHFPVNPVYRKPPFNLVAYDEVWEYF